MKAKLNMKRIFSMFLALLMVCSVITVTPKKEVYAASGSYGLMDNIQDGTILHCFDWKYTDIIAELPSIAEAGFTSVQTSPAQVGCNSGTWYWLYQPLGFYAGTNDLGTVDELKRLCSEADKYGIKVVVDVVANHLAGDHSNIQSELKGSEYWHTYGSVSSWSDRYQVTHGEIGMPDLNSEHSRVQEIVAGYINELKGYGVDGIRWDAAKHIGLPSEDCQFWPEVTSQGLFHYGEILVGPDDRSSGNEGLMKEYTNYMTVTDSTYGKTLRDSFAGGNAPSAYGNWAARGISNNKLIYWAESHDTWSNGTDWGYSHGMSQNVIDRAYAVAASRNDVCALYFSRPESTVKENIKAGQKGSTAFKSAEIAAVNKFHNAKDGEKDYYTTGSNCSVVNRETGAVVVAGSGSNMTVTVPNGGSTSEPGTYVDAITGETWNVTSTQMTGKIGSSGIAVLYLGGITTEPKPTISQAGGSFTTDTLTLTIGLSNATSGTYKIGNGTAKSYTSSTSITIGSDMAIGDSVTITLTATDGSDTTTKTYTFNKVEKSQNIVYYQNSNNWSNVSAHIWSDSKDFTTWPGTAMTSVGNGVYSVEIPDGATSIIFNDGKADGAQQTDDLTIQLGKIYKDGSWTNYEGGDDPIDPDDPSEDFEPPYDKGIYFDNAVNWSNVNIYYWSDANPSMVAWPGTPMTKLSNGYYGFDLSSVSGATYVIFNAGSDANKSGDLTLKENYLYNISGPVSEVVKETKGKVTVKYVDESGNSIATAKTLTGTVGSSYTTSAVTVDGYELKTTPSNATGKYTEADITVTYVYSVYVDTEPKITSSLASGSTFKTETQTITLTLANATGGTYSVDDGPVKTFTSKANVVLGQGKVADSTVTVKATAIGSDNTAKSFTFTYNKEFNGTVDEENGTVSTYSTSTTSVATYSTVATASSQGLASQYATNAKGTGKNATITIDGSFSDWSEDMLIAQGAAWDVANHYKGGHENCVLDTYSLYGAWDDTNLYVGWQMVNTTDTWARSGDGPLSDGGRVLDVPLILALSVDPTSTSMSNKNTNSGPIWGQKMGLEFDVHVDNLLYMSGKPGLGEPSLFKAVDSNGNTDYEEGCIGFAEGGIEYKMAEGNISSSIIGLNSSDDPSDVCSDSADWVDYKTFTGSAGAHDTQYDSFYEIKIPLSVLGITKSQIEANGIGAMLVATRGESGLDCIPFDTTMLDNATESYSADPSTSFEKEDVDTITASLARIGSGSPIPPIPPVPDELVLNFGAEKSSPQVAGTALTLTGIAEGGTASYTYKYYVGSTLLGTKTGSGETSVTWTPSSAGEYLIKCVVTDADGNSVTSSKYYVIENGGSDDPIDPDDPTLSGLCKASDGNWYYYVNGVIDTSFTGMAKNQYGWRYVKAGKLDLTYTGMATNKYGTWYMNKGKLDTKYTGMVKYKGEWVYVKAGKLDTTYTGMAKNKYGWWYMNKGKLDLTYTGLATNKYGTWYMNKGKLDTKYTGMVKYNGAWVYVKAGKLNTTYTGMAKNQYGWWYMKAGKLDLTYTGLATNKYGTWYMKKGKLDLTYTGKVSYNGVTYNVVKGKVV